MKAAWKKISQGLVLGTALTVAANAQAVSEGDANVGALLGWVAPKDVDSRFGFGVEGNYAVIDDLTVGAYVQYNTKKQNNVTNKNLPFGLTVNYHLPMVEGLYVGANVGMLRVSAKAGGTSTSTNGFSFGGQAGYDYMLTDEFSVGAMYQYIWAATEDTAKGFENTYAHNFFASAKFHF